MTYLGKTTGLIWVLALLALGHGQSLPREARTKIMEAVVQIVPTNNETGKLVDWSGSGTIISPQGYILTNFHVIGDPDTRQHNEWHGIFVTRPNAADQPPQLEYWAQYVTSDPTSDLAILKIEEFANEEEEPVPDTFTFPAVPVGDSNTLLPGDLITVVGYPGISGTTITFTAGLMSGWLGEDFESGGKQWIKTDAKIARGNSGGAAFNEFGELIGVPTSGNHVLEGTVHEEQLYVRPIGVAWALIGPNVPDLVRTNDEDQSSPNTASGNGSYGSLSIGSARSNTIAAPAPGDEYPVYHSYVVEVPAGTSQLVVEVDGQGHDLDLAAKAGSAITSYEAGQLDYKEFSAKPNPRYVINDPDSGTLHVDVVNRQIDQPASYKITVTATDGDTQSTTAQDIPTETAPSDPADLADAQEADTVTDSDSENSSQPGSDELESPSEGTATSPKPNESTKAFSGVVKNYPGGPAELVATNDKGAIIGVGRIEEEGRFSVGLFDDLAEEGQLASISESFVDCDVTISDEAALSAGVWELTVVRAGERQGIIEQVLGAANAEIQPQGIVNWWYSDRAVAVKGSCALDAFIYTYDLDLQQGWNIIVGEAEIGSIAYMTAMPPNDARWFFTEFGDVASVPSLGELPQPPASDEASQAPGSGSPPQPGSEQLELPGAVGSPQPPDLGDSYPMQKLQRHLSVSVPNEWSFNESMTLLSPDGMANVIVSSEPIDSSLTAQAYAEVQGDQLRTEFPEYREFELVEAQVFGGRPGYSRHFEWKPADAERVTQIQLYYAESGRGYTATATTPSTNFEELESQLRQVLAGLVIEP